MKKILFCAFMCLFLACVSAQADTSIQPETGDYPKDQAVRTATELFQKVSGIDQNGLKDYETIADLYEAFALANISMPRRWQIVFSLKENPEIRYTVMIESPSGVLYSAEPADFPARLFDYKKKSVERADAIEHGKVWIAEKGPWEFWSYQDKAAFVTANGRGPNGNKGMPFGLPGEKDVGLDQALITAKAAIMDHFSATNAQLGGLKLDCAFFPGWKSTAGKVIGAWIIAFRKPEPRQDGEYVMIYQAIVLSPGCEIETIYKQEYQDGENGEPLVVFWPSEVNTNVEPSTLTGKVYYNSNGGKYYHVDAACPSVDSKYLPMTGIDRSQLLKRKFSALLPCPYCAKEE